MEMWKIPYDIIILIPNKIDRCVSEACGHRHRDIRCVKLHCVVFIGSVFFCNLCISPPFF